MLAPEDLTITAIRKELDKISKEMVQLIRKYNLDAQSPLDIINIARTKITDQNDYIRFLELSLEGRIYGEAAEAITQQQEKGGSVH